MRVFLSFFLSIFCVTPAFSYERIEGVYEAIVPLADRSNDARNQAIRQGLEQVFIRYTGYSSISNFLEVSRELDSAQRYVIEYGVETIRLASDDGLGVEESDGLWIRYNSALVDQLAQDLELPIWPTLRPTLSYVVINELWGEPQVPQPESFPALWLHLERAFAARGLQATAFGETQLRGLDVENIWDLDENTASRLMARSGSNITVVIRVKQQRDTYELDFAFIEPESETLIRHSGSELYELLAAGIDDYVDGLSTGLAFLGGTEKESDLYIRVEGARTYSEYKSLLNQIAGLEQVISVRMESATDSSIGYLISYQSDPALLIDSISTITGLNRLPQVANQESVLALPGSLDNPIYFQNPNSTIINNRGNKS